MSGYTNPDPHYSPPPPPPPSQPATYPSDATAVPVAPPLSAPVTAYQASIPVVDVTKGPTPIQQPPPVHIPAAAYVGATYYAVPQPAAPQPAAPQPIVIQHPVKANEHYVDDNLALYAFMGVGLAILIGIFVFLFFCCAENAGIVGKRRTSFLIGSIIGNLVNLAVWVVLVVLVFAAAASTSSSY